MYTCVGGEYRIYKINLCLYMYMYMYVSEQIQRVGGCTCILLHAFYLAYFCLYFGKDILCIDASLGNIFAADLQHNTTHDHNQYRYSILSYITAP